MDDGSYSIRNVVCADEYAEGDDNAFTNGTVIRALQDAAKAASICGLKAPVIWKEIAAKLRIPKFENGVTMEYDGYNGQVIKQADANLLVYPLNLITRPEEIRKDLEYYEGKIDKGGPAMSFSVLALQYARLVKGIRLMNYLCKASVPTSYLRSVYFLKVQEVLILISQLVREDFCRL